MLSLVYSPAASAWFLRLASNTFAAIILRPYSPPSSTMVRRSTRTRLNIAAADWYDADQWTQCCDGSRRAAALFHTYYQHKKSYNNRRLDVAYERILLDDAPHKRTRTPKPGTSVQHKLGQTWTRTFLSRAPSLPRGAEQRGWCRCLVRLPAPVCCVSAQRHQRQRLFSNVAEAFSLAVPRQTFAKDGAPQYRDRRRR